MDARELQARAGSTMIPFSRAKHITTTAVYTWHMASSIRTYSGTCMTAEQGGRETGSIMISTLLEFEIERSAFGFPWRLRVSSG